MPPSQNNYIKLLDQGLSAFVFERDENDKPVLSDQPTDGGALARRTGDIPGRDDPSLSTLISLSLVRQDLSNM